MAAALINLTDAGRAALVGPGNVGTVQRTVVSIGIATAPFEPRHDLTVLPHERAPRISAIGGKNIAPDTIHVTMRDDSADQYAMYGFGLYLDNGVLLGTYGQATPILEKSPLSWMVTSVDIRFATIDAATLVFGDASFINPPASTTVEGVVELADDEETKTGTDPHRAVTPASLSSRTATESRTGLAAIATQEHTDSGTDDSRIVTPKKLARRLASYAPLVSPAFKGNATLTEGRLLVGAIVDDGSGAVLQVTGFAVADTPAAGDWSRKLATTAFVMSALATASVGQIILEPRATTRAGCLKLSGALLNRADYPALWAYAQASAAIVSEDEWTAGGWGCFSYGDGKATFRIPDYRGEFPRFWDDGRGADISRAIGRYQAPDTMSHYHTAVAAWNGDHVHSAWTDAQGWHGHGISDPGHSHDMYVDVSIGPSNWNSGAAVTGVSRYGNTAGRPTPIQGHGTGIGVNGDGSHGHNVGIGGGGYHSHTITVNPSGGSETRVRNVSMLAMIRAF
ncbi:phage tail protein [Cupriavidus pinatubonensis]|uniref:phage tail protein n=1 Tax=Cupriavidus pinatubonensis TaxID=248026 RepID=UPI001127D68C|nr:phage tail protein [Cupriavidus pinatubonensis]TPQ33414.1 phage tail protein [Cupriavidus pinatubonensis]